MLQVFSFLHNPHLSSIIVGYYAPSQEEMMNFIKENLAGYGVSEQMSVYLSNIIMVLCIAVLSVVANLVAKKSS